MPHHKLTTCGVPAQAKELNAAANARHDAETSAAVASREAQLLKQELQHVKQLAEAKGPESASIVRRLMEISKQRDRADLKALRAARTVELTQKDLRNASTRQRESEARIAQDGEVCSAVLGPPFARAWD